MATKTMEFDHLVVKYNYRDGSMTLQRKTERDGPLEEQTFALDLSQVSELKEAYEGIGQQIPTAGHKLRRTLCLTVRSCSGLFADTGGSRL